MDGFSGILTEFLIFESDWRSHFLWKAALDGTARIVRNTKENSKTTRAWAERAQPVRNDSHRKLADSDVTDEARVFVNISGVI
jgi:hypothetical protein